MSPPPQDFNMHLLPTRQQSFYKQVQQDDDIGPLLLSGDESAQQSVISSSIANQPKANFMLSVTTIMKTVIGAGIISLPSTISKLGYVFGVFMYLLVVAINHFTAMMLLKSKNLSRHSNYSSIMRHLFNSNAAKAICSLLILYKNVGMCIIELTIIKQAVHQISEQIWVEVKGEFYVSQWFIVLVVALLQVPLAVVEKIQKLKFMAFIGVAGIGCFVVCLIVTFFDQLALKDLTFDHMRPFPSDWFKVAAAIPKIMVALTFQINFFPIFKGLNNSNDKKMSYACLVALSTVVFFYIIVGNVGYAMYGSDVATNFLLNLKYNDLNHILFIGMNGGFLLSIFFSFPVMFFGARNNFIALVQMFFNRKKSTPSSDLQHHNTIQQISQYIQNGNKLEKKRKAKLQFYILTGILFSIIVVVGMTVGNVDAVFNLVGAVASNAIGYIFPCMFYYLLVKFKNKNRNYNFYIARILFYIFIPFGVFSVVTNFL